MGRKALHIVNFGVDSDVLAHNLNAFNTFYQPASDSALCLIAGKYYAAVLTPQIMLKVMQNTSGICHAAGRNNNLAARNFVNRHGFLHRCGKAQVMHRHQPASLHSVKCPRFLIIFLGIRHSNLRSSVGHRTIYINRNLRNFAFRLQLLEIVQQYLRTPYSKRRNNNVTATLDSIVNNIRQLALLIVGFMDAVAVGGFRNNKIRTACCRRVLNNRLVGLADIAGKNQARLFIAFVNRHFYESRAKNVSRNAEGDGNTGNNIKRFTKAAQLEQMQGSGSIINRKQRLDNFFAGTHTFAIGVFCLTLLNVRAVRQQNRAQLLRRFSAIDGAAEAFLDQLRQQTAVVNMGVRQYNSLNLSRMKQKILFIQRFYQLGALEHAAVYQKLVSADLQQIAGTGNGARCT